jgi:GDP-L-fucose synthase
MVGAALVRRLGSEGCTVLTVDRRTVDLRRQREVEDWLGSARPDLVFVAAAVAGGIQANSTRPAEFLYDNLAIETNLIHGAWRVGVEKLLFLGSTCIYPRLAPQPMKEEALLTGPLEPTNEWYAIAKIAGIKLCDAYRRQYGADFISAQPTNLYGPFDNFDVMGGHVMPALMRRIHEAKEAGAPEVAIWGTGKPLREFLHVDDLADALVFLVQRYSQEGHVNIGTGEEVSIRQLAESIVRVVGYRGRLIFDPSKPDGMPRKLGDVSKLNALGWHARIKLEDGLAETYRWFLDHIAGRHVNRASEAVGS